MRPLRVSVLVSGEGTTMAALADRWAPDPSPPGRIVLVLADRSGAPALERARARGLPAEILSPKEAGGPDAWASALDARLVARGTDLVILAGFLSILPPAWVDRWGDRAINLHPSLLPRFGGPGMHGRHVHEAVLASGEGETGVTVHVVTASVDRGPILWQERLPIRAGETPETLRQRLAPLEVDALDRVVRRFADGRLPLPYR
ncbi:MAG: phosphoribosylglycinamide formyltransferase [Thermoplasmata archaeon]